MCVCVRDNTSDFKDLTQRKQVKAEWWFERMSSCTQKEECVCICVCGVGTYVHKRVRVCVCVYGGGAPCL